MIHQRFEIKLLAVLLLAAGTGALALAPSSAQHAFSVSACSAPANLLQFTHPLSRTAQRVSAGQPLTVVALGSSSTAGAGASTTAANYPSRLAVELTKRYPLSKVSVLNRGVNGEEMPEMLARFDQSVAAEKPDLVLWQLGTNSVLRDRKLTQAPDRIRTGLARLKAIAADVVLINPQYAPKVLAKAESAEMVEIISKVAAASSINVFDRFSVMRHWRLGENLPFNAFLSPDELHMNDWSYGCVAKLMAGMIAQNVARPALTASSSAIRR